MNLNEIEIKETHINQGEPEDPHHCPIALALREHARSELDDKLYEVLVEDGCVFYVDTIEGLPNFTIHPTRHGEHLACEFINRFDETENARPTTIPVGQIEEYT